MNKRIKELREQAWTMVSDEQQAHGELYETRDRWDKYDQKFAELIVRECANQCDLLLDNKISSEWSRGTHDCSRAIKKHFGVEE